MVTNKVLDEVKNFELPPWRPNEDGNLSRIQGYTFVKSVMMARYVIKVVQTQTKTTTIPGKLYIVDSVTENSGIMYADYIRVPIQWRFIREDLFNGDRSIKENKRKTRLQITYEVEWVKACLMKGKVETETYNNLKKFYEVLEKELRSDEGVQARIKNVGEVGNHNGSIRNRKHASRGSPPENKNTHAMSSAVRTEPNPDDMANLRERFQYRENLLTCACILLLVTMVFTTLAMYKLSSTISLLSEKMNEIEKSTILQHRHQDEFLKSLRTQQQV